MTGRPPIVLERGQRFGRLTVVEPGRMPNGNRAYLCRCDCGQETTVATTRLTSGATRSCGCLLRGRHHGLTETPEYQTWVRMKQRCKGSPYYVDVEVYPEWCDDFRAFYDYVVEHMGLRPSPHHSIDRINPFGNYEPGNVRWATALEQRHNRRDNYVPPKELP